MSALRIELVTAERVPDADKLWSLPGGSSGCYCQWFIIPVTQYHAGGAEQNRRLFCDMVEASTTPVGLFAYDDTEPIAWCAAGPRSRYKRALRVPSFKGRDPSEDDSVWFVPCFFVRQEYRREGVSTKMLTAAVDLARTHGATAIEGFPFSHGAKLGAESMVGVEAIFQACGFVESRRPSKTRVVMRRELRTQPLRSARDRNLHCLLACAHVRVEFGPTAVIGVVRLHLELTGFLIRVLVNIDALAACRLRRLPWAVSLRWQTASLDYSGLRLAVTPHDPRRREAGTTGGIVAYNDLEGDLVPHLRVRGLVGDVDCQRFVRTGLWFETEGSAAFVVAVVALDRRCGRFAERGRLWRYLRGRCRLQVRRRDGGRIGARERSDLADVVLRDEDDRRDDHHKCERRSSDAEHP